MSLTVNNSYTVKLVGIITHQFLCEWVFLFFLGTSLAELCHIIYHMGSQKNGISMQQFSYLCTWVYIKMVEFDCITYEITQLFTNPTYIDIPYIVYFT